VAHSPERRHPTAAIAPPDHDSRDAISWLEGRKHLGIHPGLSRVVTLLEAMGNPQDAYRSIHIAGTNGKGSVATYIASALEEAGHHTGLFTSPALLDVTETISVDGTSITNDELARLVDRLKPATKQLDDNGDPSTYFELLTVIALTWFREVGVAWAVVEAGMGGRLDSTNILQPELAVITNVSHDHQAHLGETIAAIAAEKAGIIKTGVPLATAAQGEALAVIEGACEEKQAPIVVVGRDYQVVPSDDDRLVLITPDGRLSYRLIAEGQHQRENAALAVASCDLLAESGIPLPRGAVERALAHTTLPGRIEVFVHGGTRVILDGAHNLAAAQSLRLYLETLDTRFHLVVGFSRDKDWPAMLRQWVHLADRVTATRMGNERSMDPALVASHVPGDVPFATASSFPEAWDRVGEADVVVAGSLFLVGEARSYLLGVGARPVPSPR
jgi:dihydrofolate synthase / folylpolyglutamate synthase